MNLFVNIRRSGFLPFLLIIFTAGPGHAQRQSQARQKNDSTHITRNNTAPPPDSVIEERLVQLALAGPQYQQSDHQVNIARHQLSKARRSWLNLLSVSANYNDQTFAKSAPTAGAYVYPKYFFGLTIPLGLFFSMGPEIKIAKEGVASSKNSQEMLAATIRADILSKYRQYKTYDTLLVIENDANVDEQAALTQLENRVHSNLASIEQYNIAHRAYGEELVKLINLKLQRDLLKIDIERMIGTRLENVLK